MNGLDWNKIISFLLTACQKQRTVNCDIEEKSSITVLNDGFQSWLCPIYMTGRPVTKKPHVDLDFFIVCQSQIGCASQKKKITAAKQKLC